jgi:hypothetical protein
MSDFPSPGDIQRWFPRRWSDIAGNAAVVETWKNFIKNGPVNALITGPSRSGKTRTISLGIRALFCTSRTRELDPCGSCPTCKALAEGRADHHGVFAAITGSEYSFHPIDCEYVTSEQLDSLRYDGLLDSNKAVVYLDEVAALKTRRLEGRMLKLIDETRAIWIASAISVKRVQGKRKGEWTERLSVAMRGRYPIKVGTSHPHPDDLVPWILARAAEWKIIIRNPEVTIPEMIRRSRRRVGYLIHMFAAAATRDDRTIDPASVDGFNLDSPD